VTKQQHQTTLFSSKQVWVRRVEAQHEPSKAACLREHMCESGLLNRPELKHLSIGLIFIQT